MSHLIITYFENLNPSLCNIKYLCDNIVQGNLDCGNKSFESINFRAKKGISSFKGLMTNKINENFLQVKDSEKKSENIELLSEMLNAANKAKQIVNSLRKS
ncbi:hypothetical protein CPHLJ_1g2295 [Cryptosporidium parvum]|nr:hypothetical protein CPCDC_1g2295 [Cryptosporidium sp. 43IA8]